MVTWSSLLRYRESSGFNSFPIKCSRDPLCVYSVVKLMTGYPRIIKSGLELIRSTGSGALGSPPSKCVPTVDARCPPAEKPMMPIRCGSIPNLTALKRTSLTALKPSISGMGCMYFLKSQLLVRYRSTKAVTPCRLNHWAICFPSWSMASPTYPPPGQIITAVPLADSAGAG